MALQSVCLSSGHLQYLEKSYPLPFPLISTAVMKVWNLIWSWHHDCLVAPQEWTHAVPSPSLAAILSCDRKNVTRFHAFKSPPKTIRHWWNIYYNAILAIWGLCHGYIWGSEIKRFFSDNDFACWFRTQILNPQIRTIFINLVLQT